jgi:hypothetical protein
MSNKFPFPHFMSEALGLIAQATGCFCLGFLILASFSWVDFTDAIDLKEMWSAGSLSLHVDYYVDMQLNEAIHELT